MFHRWIATTLAFALFWGLVSCSQKKEFRSTPSTSKKITPEKNNGNKSPPIPPPEEIPIVQEKEIKPLPSAEKMLENFDQKSASGPVDILIVVDDSGSMAEEQKNLSTKMNDLLLSLKDADWQIGVVTTSSSTNYVEAKPYPCKMQLIKSTDANRDEAFAKAVTPGINGSGITQGIRQAVTGLKCTEKPWVRPDSTVAVLFISDEDNCAQDGTSCLNSPGRRESYLIDYVEREMKRTVGMNAGFYGIIPPVGEVCPTKSFEAPMYQRLFEYKANGKVNYGNICDSSYKPVLERISKNIAQLLNSQFKLKKTPDSNTVVVKGKKADGAAISRDDYTIVGDMIFFRSGEEPGQGLFEVEYFVTPSVP